MCVCVCPSLDCIVEKKVASQRPIVPSSPVRTGIKNTKMLYLRMPKPITDLLRCILTVPHMPNIPNGRGAIRISPHLPFPLAGLLMAAPTVSSHVGSQPLNCWGEVVLLAAKIGNIHTYEICVPALPGVFLLNVDRKGRPRGPSNTVCAQAESAVPGSRRAQEASPKVQRALGGCSCALARQRWRRRTPWARARSRTCSSCCPSRSRR